MNTFIRLLYALLIAGAVVTFVAVSIYTFYPGPKAPDYNPPFAGKASPAIVTRIDETYQHDYDLANQRYQEAQKDYMRNVSIILVIVAVIIVAGGIWLRNRSDIIGEGLSLGGVGTSIYAVGAATVGDNRVMRFLAVTVFLAGVLVLVYVKFNDKPLEKKPTPKHT